MAPMATIWEHVPKKYHFWTIIKQKKEKSVPIWKKNVTIWKKCDNLEKMWQFGKKSVKIWKKSVTIWGHGLYSNIAPNVRLLIPVVLGKR